MLKEALQYLASLKQDALALREAPGAPEDERYLFFDRRGEFVRETLPPPPREHGVGSLDSFAAASARFATEDSSTWVSLGSVCTLLDDTDDSHRCDRLVMRLSPHHAFARLEQSGVEWRAQAAFIDMLRHDLNGTLLDPDNLLATVRQLKFATASEQMGNYTATSAALGRKVESQLTGANALPETISVEFHPYPAFADELDVSVVVFCTLFVNPENGLLKLAPRPGDIEAAQQKAMTALAALLAEKTAGPAFVGVP